MFRSRDKYRVRPWQGEFEVTPQDYGDAETAYKRRLLSEIQRTQNDLSGRVAFAELADLESRFDTKQMKLAAQVNDNFSQREFVTYPIAKQNRLLRKGQAVRFIQEDGQTKVRTSVACDVKNAHCNGIVHHSDGDNAQIQIAGTFFQLKWHEVVSEGHDLEPGRWYYVSRNLPYNLTTEPNEIVSPVGYAVSPQKLVLSIQPPYSAGVAVLQ